MASGEWRVASETERPTPAVRSYRDLRVWRLTLDWVEAIYRLTEDRPRDERFGLTSQTRRAAVSVAANIAEGAARRTTGELLQFIGIARGSLAETETLLILAERLGYLAEPSLRELTGGSEEINRMLAGLTFKLKARQ